MGVSHNVYSYTEATDLQPADVSFQMFSQFLVIQRISTYYPDFI